MADAFDVVVLVGSLRRESHTRRATQALLRLAPSALRFEAIEIGDLALYDEDLEASPPQPWRVFRDRIRRCDGVLFATPEYNRSVPACLKNAVDVASRPYVSNAWADKPGAVIGMSPGALGAFGAQHHLRQSLVAVGVPTMPQPDVYLGHVDRALGPDGEFVNVELRGFLMRFMDAYARWIERFAASR